ncbi:MAG: hypothetical protein JO326_01300, partial [Acetobacteraceae bacterium]|nr:hypothetical protein [Acetobacteraceae bacterium]
MNRWFHSAGPSSHLVSIDRFIDERIFATRPGAYGATFKLSGGDPECLSDPELANISARLVQAMRLIPEECTLQQIVVKRRGCDLAPSKYEDSANEIVAATQRARRHYLAGRNLGAVELYWTLTILPAKSRRQPKPSENAAINERMLRTLRNTVTVLHQNLSDLIGMEPLGCHQIGELYSYLANLEPALVRKRLASRDVVGRQLSRVAVEWRSDGLTMGKRYARLFSLIQRPNATRPNLFGELMRLDADLVLVLEAQRRSAVDTRKCVATHQTFKDLFRHSVLSVLAHAKAGKEPPRSANTVAADKAVDSLGGIVDDIENRGLTYTQTSLIGMLHSRDKRELDDVMAQVHRVFSQSEAAVLEEGLGSLSAYQSLFPAAMHHGQSSNVRRFWLREDHLANLSLVYAPYL